MIYRQRPRETKDVVVDEVPILVRVDRQLRQSIETYQELHTKALYAIYFYAINFAILAHGRYSARLILYFVVASRLLHDPSHDIFIFSNPFFHSRHQFKKM